MSHYSPTIDKYGRWVAQDTVDGQINPTPVYATREAAQSWCDIHNAMFSGADQDEMDRLYARHEEVRAVPDLTRRR